MSKVFDQLLRVRDYEAGFLKPKYEDCLDPYLLPGMQAAVERVKQAVKQGEKILIYGDYDVDGVTATTVLWDTLRLAGVKEVMTMLPNRFTDGYGMSKKVVQKAKSTEAELVMTVDCGSRNHEIVAELKAAGIDTIVTDHHECGETLPEAVAVVNPKRQDWQDGTEVERAALRNLAGVGVVFKLAQALVRAGLIPAGQEKWLLDLVVLGTVCDSMRLRDENRRLCYYGFKVLEKTRRPGLKELIEKAHVRQFDTEAVGFQLGPRLNAAGRMETADIALRVLMAEKRTVAARLAAQLEKLNATRKQQQIDIIEEIEQRGVVEGPVIVEMGDWHEGIIGIVAGRLVEEFRRPAFVFTEADGVLKGSGRSFGEFNLAEALDSCREYILGGGGHAEACGLKLPLDGLEKFRRAVNAYYESLGLKEQERFLEVQPDVTVRDYASLSLELLDEMRQLEPYGDGNPEPVFFLPEARVVEAAKLGAEQNHLRLTVWDNRGQSLKLMCFNAPEDYLRLQGGETIDAWITLCENEYRGLRSVEGRIVKLR